MPFYTLVWAFPLCRAAGSPGRCSRSIAICGPEITLSPAHSHTLQNAYLPFSLPPLCILRTVKWPIYPPAYLCCLPAYLPFPSTLDIVMPQAKGHHRSTGHEIACLPTYLPTYLYTLLLDSHDYPFLANPKALLWPQHPRHCCGRSAPGQGLASCSGDCVRL